MAKVKKKARKIRKPARKTKQRKKISRPKKAKKILVKKKKKSALIKKVKAKPAKKRAAQTVAPEYQTEALFKAKIKVIGVGGGGGSIVSEMGRTLEKATFVIADTDMRALKNKSGIKYFCFGEEYTHGLGTGVNVDIGRQAAESAKDRMGSFFEGQDIIIFVASLGGGLGSGATQIFADAARQFGGITFGIFTMPFKFEGRNKYKIAQNALKSLRKSLNVSLVIPNEKIFKVIDESTPITNAFSMVNKNLISSLESLIGLIYNPGIINIDFADLRTILKGRGNSAFLNTIEASGKDRVEKTCKGVFKNLLLQNSGFKAEKILFNVSGSENLSMFEIEKISSHISDLNPKAKIIFGISKSPKLGGRIKTTILMTGGGGQNEPDEAAEAKKKPDKSAKRILTGPSQSRRKASLVGKAPKKQIKAENIAIPRALDIPVFEVPVPAPIMEPVLSSKKTIRRSALEIREAEDLQEKKKIAQEKEWEIPAFLRKVKFKS